MTGLDCNPGSAFATAGLHSPRDHRVDKTYFVLNLFIFDEIMINTIKSSVSFFFLM